jgi:hypothetical protein
VGAAFLSKLLLSVGEAVVTRRDFDKRFAAYWVVHIGKNRSQFFGPLAVLVRAILILIHLTSLRPLCHI